MTSSVEPGGAQPDSAPVGSATDAASPVIDCVDDDGDGAWLSLTGVDCGPIVDCDDSDPRAHPGQTDFFTTERASGGWDFDCDGVETPINDQQGDPCYSEWFECKGTGWMNGVPGCGTVGVYHECVDGFLSCNEAQLVAADQLCR